MCFWNYNHFNCYVNNFLLQLPVVFQSQIFRKLQQLESFFFCVKNGRKTKVLKKKLNENLPNFRPRCLTTQSSTCDIQKSD